MVYYSVILGKGLGLNSRGTWSKLTEVFSGAPEVPARCELGEFPN